MSQATLRTRRLLLVPLGDEHLGHEIELDSDPEVMRHLTGRASSREQVEREHRERLAVARRAPGLGCWAGSTAEDGVVGWWLLEPPTPPRVGEAALGYRLLRRHWRRGLASEGSRALLHHAFDDLGLTRVSAETMAVNTASRATMASLGMRHIRTFHETWDDPLPGSDLGETEYAITRDQWSRTDGAAPGLY